MTAVAIPGTGSVPATVQALAAKSGHLFPWKALAPIAVAVVLAILPPPDGPAQHAWYFFAIFTA